MLVVFPMHPHDWGPFLSTCANMFTIFVACIPIFGWSNLSCLIPNISLSFKVWQPVLVISRLELIASAVTIQLSIVFLVVLPFFKLLFARDSAHAIVNELHVMKFSIFLSCLFSPCAGARKKKLHGKQLSMQGKTCPMLVIHQRTVVPNGDSGREGIPAGSDPLRWSNRYHLVI